MGGKEEQQGVAAGSKGVIDTCAGEGSRQHVKNVVIVHFVDGNFKEYSSGMCSNVPIGKAQEPACTKFATQIATRACKVRMYTCIFLCEMAVVVWPHPYHFFGVVPLIDPIVSFLLLSAADDAVLFFAHSFGLWCVWYCSWSCFVVDAGGSGCSSSRCVVDLCCEVHREARSRSNLFILCRRILRCCITVKMEEITKS